MLWVEGPSAHCSLLCCVLATVHCAALTLTHTVVVVSSVSGAAELLAKSLASVATAAHYVFSKRASLLNGRFQVLVGLLLDRLCIL